MFMRSEQWRVTGVLCCLLSAGFLPGANVAIAEEQTDEPKFRLRMEYQFTRTGTFDTDFGPYDLGETTTQATLISGVYSVNERWKVFATIPYVRKRHRGAAAHIIDVDFANYTPPDLREVDDGEYHGGFQDLYVGAQYLAIDGPVSVSPYIAFGTPMTNYPIYGNAIIGKQLWEVPIGAAIDYSPYFSDWHFQADVSYVFSESVMDVDLDYWHWYASAGYYITPQFSPRVFLTQRIVPNGLTLNDFSDADWDSEKGYNHDRTLKHGFLNGGVGFDYIVNNRLSISANYFKTIEQDEVAKIESAFTLALTHRF